MTQHRELAFDTGFHVVAGNADSQAAVMVISPGRSVGGPHNRHAASDQWLYVVSGEGAAVVEGAERPLRAGTLLLIERGEGHEIRNTGRSPLETLNFYVPPEYAPHR